MNDLVHHTFEIKAELAMMLCALEISIKGSHFVKESMHNIGSEIPAGPLLCTVYGVLWPIASVVTLFSEQKDHYLYLM